MPCWWNRDWFRGQENKPQLVASVQRECASPTLGALPQWLKGSIRSVLRREKASNSVSPLSLKSLQWLMPHTPSPISHVVSFHIRSHRPCWRNITLWYSRTVATPSGATHHNLDAEKSNSICLCRKWPLVCWSLQLWAPILLCSFLKAGSTSRQSDGGSIRVKE